MLQLISLIRLSLSILRKGELTKANSDGSCCVAYRCYNHQVVIPPWFPYDFEANP